MKTIAIYETHETFQTLEIVETTESEPVPDTLRSVKLDELALRACDGDREAIGAIAIFVGPLLLQEVKKVLGTEYEDEAEDELQELYVCLLERMCPEPPVPKDAMRWLFVVTRAHAAEWRKERERDPRERETEEG
jgi:hypothetical protein